MGLRVRRPLTENVLLPVGLPGRPRGRTALYDAIANSIADTEKKLRESGKNVRVARYRQQNTSFVLEALDPDPVRGRRSLS